MIEYIMFFAILAPALLYFWFIDKKFNGLIHVKWIIPLIVYFLGIAVLFGIFPYTPFWFALMIAVLIQILPIGMADRIFLVLAILTVPAIIVLATVMAGLIIKALDKKNKLAKPFIRKNKKGKEEEHKILAPYLLIGFIIFTMLSLAFYSVNYFINPTNIATVTLVPIDCFGANANIVVNTINSTLTNYTQNTVIEYRGYCYQIKKAYANQSVVV